MSLPLKTTKTINKQIQTNENGSRKALLYKEKAAEILRSSKTKDGCIKKGGKHFACVAASSSQERCPWRYPGGKGIPACLTVMDACGLCYWRLSHYPPMLIAVDEPLKVLPQKATLHLLFPRAVAAAVMRLVPRHPYSCYASIFWDCKAIVPHHLWD